ncbi:hypothetical protein [Sorangium sp. So ce341]|uniref:hypothetical protein n=1 Tax=Sorangium sp. So ce341 TaxID=3133302 RepID=UPI003F638D51
MRRAPPPEAEMFWTSTPEDDGRWWVRMLGHFKNGIYRVTSDGRDAGSVRCVKP